MKYSSVIDINPIFLNSINLQFDLNDEEKIKQYIPTREACSILGIYIDSIIYQDKKEFRASVLYGPYGKGKSFLVLILLYIISADSKSDVYQSLLHKIEAVDQNLFEKIQKLNGDGYRLLPVIINSDYDDLDQAFLIGLTDAQMRESLERVVPKTSFDSALEVIDRWIKESAENPFIISLCQTKLGIDLPSLKEGVEKKDIKKYKDFCCFYECVSGGIPFNPLIRKNAANNLKTVAENVAGQYTGLFVVFDEFSKFIESGSPYLSQQLKILQDSFEIATRSTEKVQIHICCINHKRLSNYAKGIATESISSFRTIEGRVKEISFTRTLGENYWIISKALTKKNDFDSKWEEYYFANKEYYDWFIDHGFADDQTKQDLFKGCFPLNPIVTYALIQLSELIAQNERTLFTFISDNDTNSLKSFIISHESGLYGIDRLFDYFSPLMKKEDGEIKSIWLKAEAILSQLENETEKHVIKAIALFQILNDSRLFPPTIEYLDKSICINNIDSVLSRLEEQSFISKDLLTEQYAVSSFSTKEINQVILEYRSNHQKVDLVNVFSSITPVKYIPARKYNTDYKMIRYYKTIYVLDNTFINANYLSDISDDPSDGTLIQVLRKDKSVDSIIDSFQKMDFNPRTIVSVSRDEISDNLIELTERYDALLAICNSEKMKSSTLSEELRILREEYKTSIKSILFEIQKNSILLSNVESSVLSEIMYKQLADSFGKTPIINNELLNKHEISSVYRKARNNVIDWVLENGTALLDVYSSTSAEQSIFQSVFGSENNGIEEVLSDINKVLNTQNGTTVSFDKIYKLLVSEPIGMREGVIPLVFAAAVYDLSNHFVMSFNGKEISLNANNLSKAFDKPRDYFYRIEEGTEEKNLFLSFLSKSFDVKTTNHFWRDLALTVDGINKYFAKLPNIVRSGDIDSIVEITDSTRKFINSFLRYDVNYYEIVFDSIPRIMGYQIEIDLEALSNSITTSKSLVDNALEKYETFLALKIKDVFGASKEESIKSAIGNWYAEKNAEEYCLDNLREKDRLLLDTILSNRISFNDIEAVNIVSKLITGSVPADWQKDRSRDVVEGLTSLIERLKEKNDDNSDDKCTTELSGVGNALKQLLLSTFEEFGDSVSVDEKRNILKDMLKELL